MKKLVVLIMLLAPFFVSAQDLLRWERIKPISAQIEISNPQGSDLLLIEDATDSTKRKVTLDTLLNQVYIDINQLNTDIQTHITIDGDLSPDNEIQLITVSDVSGGRKISLSKSGGSTSIVGSSPITINGYYPQNDIIISHAFSAGNKHIPALGATGNILQYSGSSGTATWGQDYRLWNSAKDSIPILSARSLQNEIDIAANSQAIIDSSLSLQSGIDQNASDITNMDLQTVTDIGATTTNIITINNEEVVTNKAKHKVLLSDGEILFRHQTYTWNGTTWVSTNGFGFGTYALRSNTGAYSNGFGNYALYSNTGAYSNGFGNSALQYNTGAYNTAIGHNTSSSNPFTYTNTTALGYNAQPTADNQVKLGDNNITSVLTTGTVTHAQGTLGTHSALLQDLWDAGVGASGGGTNGYLAKFNASGGIENSPAIASSPTTIDVNEASIGGWTGGVSIAFFGNKVTNTSTGYAMLQTSLGRTILNSESGQDLSFRIGASEVFQVDGATKNLLLGTTTDNGYKLDVNGTGIFRDSISILGVTSGVTKKIINLRNSGGYGIAISEFGVSARAPRLDFLMSDFNSGSPVLDRNVMSMHPSGNITLGTTTDNGSKFQNNGTSWLNGEVTMTAGATVATDPTDPIDVVNLRTMQSAISDSLNLAVKVETDPLFTAWDKDYNDLINKPTIPTYSTISEGGLYKNGSNNYGLSSFNTGNYSTYIESAPANTYIFAGAGLSNGSAGTFKISELIKDDAYGAGWNGSNAAATRNAIYDKINSLVLGVSDGDKGDITVSSSGANWQIDAGVIGSTELASYGVTALKLNDNIISGQVSATPVLTDELMFSDAGSLRKTTFSAVKTLLGAGDMLKSVYDTNADNKIDLAAGGTGVTSFDSYELLIGGTGNYVDQVVGVGTAGQVLTSNGAGAKPTFQTPSAGASSISKYSGTIGTSGSTFDFPCGPLINSTTTGSITNITFMFYNATTNAYYGMVKYMVAGTYNGGSIQVNGAQVATTSPSGLSFSFSTGGTSYPRCTITNTSASSLKYVISYYYSNN